MKLTTETPPVSEATNLESYPDTGSYTVETSLNGVLNFYRARMVEGDWTMNNDNSGKSKSAVSLEFNTDGKTVMVDAIVQGEKIIVIMQKK